ncbi:MAG: hypothetical protein KF752_16185 [Pirellulaceae bacterium]|nr:hypothetical protein [Pirellulaceae bacterium]
MMAVQEKILWKNWATSLRQSMMTSLTPEVTKSVASIIDETGTAKAESTLNGFRFWQACQEGKSPNEVLTLSGFEIDFTPDENRKVHEVTFRLNKTWKDILQGVLDRKRN